MTREEWLERDRPRWVAIAFGALDVSGHDAFMDGTEILVTPTVPGVPLALAADGAALWRRLVRGSVTDEDMSDEESRIVREMAEAGIASRDQDHPARVDTLSAPWLSSPLHELVYALVQCIADDMASPAIFIKGPVLHHQGLRAREHSGDVDVWVRREDLNQLCRELERWGWTHQRNPFSAVTYHSETFSPPAWGCEIDVHFRFPGVNVPGTEAFDVLCTDSPSFDMSGIAIRAPAAPIHAVLQALHLIRPVPGMSVSSTTIEEAAFALRAGGEATVEAAQKLRAINVLKSPFSAAFPGADFVPKGDEIPAEWYWRSAENRAVYHWRVLSSLPWYERPKAFWRVAWPSRTAVERALAKQDIRSGSLIAARLRRLWLGVRQLMWRPSENHPVAEQAGSEER